MSNTFARPSLVTVKAPTLSESNEHGPQRSQILILHIRFLPGIHPLIRVEEPSSSSEEEDNTGKPKGVRLENQRKFYRTKCQKITLSEQAVDL